MYKKNGYLYIMQSSTSILKILFYVVCFKKNNDIHYSIIFIKNNNLKKK